VLEAVKVWPGKGEACRKVGVTANLVQISARIDVNDAQVETKKWALRSNQETDEGKLRRPGELLDKKTQAGSFALAKI
jgi:hypothetical protein